AAARLSQPNVRLADFTISPTHYSPDEFRPDTFVYVRILPLDYLCNRSWIDGAHFIRAGNDREPFRRSHDDCFHNPHHPERVLGWVGARIAGDGDFGAWCRLLPSPANLQLQRPVSDPALAGGDAFAGGHGHQLHL